MVSKNLIVQPLTKRTQIEFAQAAEIPDFDMLIKISGNRFPVINSSIECLVNCLLARYSSVSSRNGKRNMLLKGHWYSIKLFIQVGAMFVDLLFMK